MSSFLLTNKQCDEGIPCWHCLRRKEKCSLQSNGRCSPEAIMPLASGPTPLSAFDEGDWAVEMYLMYHYASFTSTSFSAMGEFGTTFRVELPRLGMDHPILLSGLLCAAALHLLS